MQIQAHGFIPSTSRLIKFRPNATAAGTLIGTSRKPFNVIKLNPARNEGICRNMNPVKFCSAATKLNSGVCFLNGVLRMNVFSSLMKNRSFISSATVKPNPGSDSSRKRKVVEHVCLLKAKEGLSEEEEKDMLDYLYTTQYQMGGIIAISLGRLSERNDENYTHAIYMRFQRKEDISKFYENPFYLKVLKDHVMPYCHGIMNFDYESEVEDDILPIFRKGEEFNVGLEFVLLIAFIENSLDGPAEDAMSSLANIMTGFPSLIVQSTQGSNFNPKSTEYTHGVAIRFQSSEAFDIFMNSSEYSSIWRSKFQRITRKSLAVHYSVDPVGTEIM